MNHGSERLKQVEQVEADCAERRNELTKRLGKKLPNNQVSASGRRSKTLKHTGFRRQPLSVMRFTSWGAPSDSLETLLDRSRSHTE